MPRSVARLSASASSHRNLFSVVFITVIAESDFRYTQWLAEQFMKSDMGMVMNIVLGIVGAAIASAILSVVGINVGDGSAT